MIDSKVRYKSILSTRKPFNNQSNLLAGMYPSTDQKPNLAMCLFLLACLVKLSLSSPSDILSEPFHLSWSDNQTRYDFIYNLMGPLKNDFRIERVTFSQPMKESLISCVGYQACLLRDGKFLIPYMSPTNNTQARRTAFHSVDKKSNNTISTCNTSDITIDHYCSTHWNPPIHLFGNGCNHVIEWHSPYTCHINTTNYARPCYIYEPEGQLIDLTPWILSNGSSYEVDLDRFNKTVKQFSLNVCNEAFEPCGPNVSACYSDNENFVESGFNNLTSIKYDAKDKAVILTTLGEYQEQCPDKRTKTQVRFLCKNQVITKTRPKLVVSNKCENIVEWSTIHACRLSDTKVPATECSIKYRPLGIDIDLNKLTRNVQTVEVTNVTIDGQQNRMILGICKGIGSNEAKCEGKLNSQTSACLVRPAAIRTGNLTADARLFDKNNTMIVGSIRKSNIRLAENRLYLESFAINKTCQYKLGSSFEATRQVGTRIEFFCSSTDESPTFLGIRECTYVFGWGSKMMCFEDYAGHIASSKIDRHSIKSESTVTLHPKEKNSNIDTNPKLNRTAAEIHKDTFIDAKKIIDQSKSANHDEEMHEKTSDNKPSSIPSKEVERQPNSNESPAGKMNNLHKFFMIGLIVMSLGAFIVIIFILDKKTQLRLPLSNLQRQARQAFQPQPVPYTRVGQFNDSLDL